MRAKRSMSLTPELVALCLRPELDPGFDPRWTPITDQELDALTQRFHEECRDQPLWVFAYGSLIWKPEFEALEHRRATVFGWHRSFCLELTRWRGSPQQPGLMMALDRGGRCDGVAYMLPPEERRAQIHRMLRREIVVREDIDMVRWVPVRTGQGPVRALVFYAGPTGDGISLKLPLDKVAGILARACGHVGSCAEYLFQTVSHLEERGIHDRNLWRLQKLVAKEIRMIHGLTGEDIGRPA